MVEFRQLLVSVILVGLFIFAFINMGIQLSNNNDANISIMDDPAINKSFGEINETLSELDEKAEERRLAFAEEQSSIATGYFILGSIFKTGTVFLSSIVGLTTGIFELISTSLGLGGVGSIVIGVFSGLIIITVVLLLWRLYKVGY